MTVFDNIYAILLPDYLVHGFFELADRFKTQHYILLGLALKELKSQARMALLPLEFSSFEWMAKAVPIIVNTGTSACKMQIEPLIGKPDIHPVMLLAPNLSRQNG